MILLIQISCAGNYGDELKLDLLATGTNIVQIAIVAHSKKDRSLIPERICKYGKME
jgi:hypothetical protein